MDAKYKGFTVSKESFCMKNQVNKFGFVLFKDTWSQKGHSVSCMTILFLNLQSPDQILGHT